MSGADYFNNAGVFLLRALFGLYILAVLLRFLLQWVRADFYNPLVQFLVQLTNPCLLPLRRMIPSFRGLDMAAVVLMLSLQVVELLLLAWLSGQDVNLPGLVVLALAELLGLLLTVLFWAILIQAVLSWFNPDFRQPVVRLLYQLTRLPLPIWIAPMSEAARPAMCGKGSIAAAVAFGRMSASAMT